MNRSASIGAQTSIRSSSPTTFPSSNGATPLCLLKDNSTVRLERKHLKQISRRRTTARTSEGRKERVEVVEVGSANTSDMAAPAAATAAKKKLVVCGGNGFLGSRICKAAVARDWDVVSISRSGEPNWPSVSSNQTAPAWSKSVKWRSANILHPETYRSDLEGANAVVHSMGILLEADYKGVLQGKESPIAGLRRAFSATKQGGNTNPMERKPGQQIEPGEKDGQLTYELMNRDSAITLAREANDAGVQSFAYISAAAGAPILPGRYISTKREAESTISSAFPKMRNLFIRPGFLFDSSRTFTMPMAAVTYGGFIANSLTGGNLTWLMGAGGAKPLKADLVAEAVVEGLSDDTVKGPVEVKEIEELANRAWRRGML